MIWRESLKEFIQMILVVINFIILFVIFFLIFHTDYGFLKIEDKKEDLTVKSKKVRLNNKGKFYLMHNN